MKKFALFASLAMGSSALAHDIVITDIFLDGSSNYAYSFTGFASSSRVDQNGYHPWYEIDEAGRNLYMGTDVASAMAFVPGIGHVGGLGIVQANHYFNLVVKWIPASRADIPSPQAIYKVYADRYHKSRTNSQAYIGAQDPGPTVTWNLTNTTSFNGSQTVVGMTNVNLINPTLELTDPEVFPPNLGSTQVLSIDGPWEPHYNFEVGQVAFNGPDANGCYWGNALILMSANMNSWSHGSSDPTIYSVSGGCQFAAWYHLTHIYDDYNI